MIFCVVVASSSCEAILILTKHTLNKFYGNKRRTTIIIRKYLKRDCLNLSMTTISALPIAIVSVILIGASVLTYKFYLSYVEDNYDNYPHIEHTDLLETAILMFFFVGITVPISYVIPIDSYPVYIIVPVVVVLFVLVVVPLHSVLIRKKERVVTQNISQEQPEKVEVDGNLKDARDDILDDE